MSELTDKEWYEKQKQACLDGAVAARALANRLRVAAAEWHLHEVEYLRAAERADERARDYLADAEYAGRWLTIGHIFAGTP